ncbi:shTK domain protein [Teladorsagia circumcincta]|uniref:ShTK domain protein n=1 Tax=Teladorsagia circumcincta TaxID=45464 RepID=A0A2G9UID8_TELCI|nr:shTK domain protein [Teladorsagia circumcincta]
MVPFDINYQETLGSPFVSFIDISMMNDLYGCKRNCEGVPSARCENGGFPHPRDCRKCVCPGGYGGDRCNERPKGKCGRTVRAKQDWNILHDTLGDTTVHRSLEDFTICTYWIESPQGTDIEVELLSFSDGFAVDGCVYAGVEIKTNKNPQVTGYRFCTPGAAGTTLRSHSNRVPIMTWNRLYKSETLLRYRYVSVNKPRPTSQTVTSFPSTSTIVTTTTTEPPLPPDVYIPGQGGRRCVDHPDCPLHVAHGLCTSNYYTLEQKRDYCPKSCNLCLSPSANDVATDAPPSPVHDGTSYQDTNKCVDRPE